MTTISVPLSGDMLKLIEELIKSGVATNKADALRKALKWFAEEQAVQAVLQSQKEPDLIGDLDDLARKI